MIRQERRRQDREKALAESDIPHVSELHPVPRVPRTKGEMQKHMSGKFPGEFRDPKTRSEKRAWDKYWTLKGRGFTKPEYKGDSEPRKRRAQSQTKKRRQKRLNNNRPRGKKV